MLSSQQRYLRGWIMPSSGSCGCEDCSVESRVTLFKACTSRKARPMVRLDQDVSRLELCCPDLGIEFSGRAPAQLLYICLTRRVCFVNGHTGISDEGVASTV